MTDIAILENSIHVHEDIDRECFELIGENAQKGVEVIRRVSYAGDDKDRSVARAHISIYENAFHDALNMVRHGEVKLDSSVDF